jgi:hypothetical protein
MINIIIGIFAIGCLFAVALHFILSKKYTTPKKPTTDKVWSQIQLTELEKILDNTFGSNSFLIPPTKIFTDDIKQCILNKMKLEYDGDEFEFMAKNDINPDPNVNTISDVELTFMLFMCKCASECFGYEWGQNNDDPIFNDETIVKSIINSDLTYKDINCAINLYKANFSKLGLKLIDFLSILPQLDSDPQLIKDFRNMKTKCETIPKPIESINNITFKAITSSPGTPGSAGFRSDPSDTPLAVQPVDPNNYLNLQLPPFTINAQYKAALFEIGKTELSGTINTINISGSFYIVDKNASYTIIILPPSGSDQQQTTLTDDSLKDSVINEPVVNSWDEFNFAGHDFSKNFNDLNINLEKNSTILLYVYGCVYFYLYVYFSVQLTDKASSMLRVVAKLS